MFRQYRKIEPKEFLLIGIDTAQGGGDYTSMQVLSQTKLDVPLVYHSQQPTSEFIPKLHRLLESLSNTTSVKPVVAIERNNGGLIHLERLSGLNYNQLYTLFKMPSMGQVNSSDGNRYGWDTNMSTRPVMLSELRTAVHQNLFTIYDKHTYNEMFSFIVKRGKPQSETNAHDDLIMALAIAWQVYQLNPMKSVIGTGSSIFQDDVNNLPENKLLDEFGFY